MSSSQATCLLCLSSNKNTINFYSDQGKDLNIISILTTHFWFQLNEVKVLSQNICCECWKNVETFHEFYQSIRLAHKEFDTVFVKVENDEDIEVDQVDGENLIYQPLQNTDDADYIRKILKLENQNAEDDESSDTSVYEIPHTNLIETGAFDVLPKATQLSYLRKYDNFTAWKTDQNIDADCFSEAVTLEYFYYLQSKYKPTSLWGNYSSLKTTIQRLNNVDISYPEVLSLLKKSSIGYQPQKINVFQPDEIQRFFSEAQDTEFLAVKVIMIFLIYGATRTGTLTKVEVNDISEQGSVFVIKMPDTKAENEIHSITVTGEYAEYVRKYKKLRPANVPHDRFFVNYQKGKCTTQPIGRNKFLQAPKAIAKFLKLDDAENYTCHSFRMQSKRKKNVSVNSELNNCDKSTEGTSSIANPTNKIGEDDIEGLPKMSQEKYLAAYDKLIAWKVAEKIDQDCFSEATLLKYIHYLQPKYKPTSLTLRYSMLTTTIQKMHNIDITHYPKIRTFLKEFSFGYRPQKCAVFEPHELRRFLCEADDNEFLIFKVIIIFGIVGITSPVALTLIDVNNVSKHGSVFVIKNPDTKANAIRSVTVQSEYATYVQKYKDLRPENVPHSRFFIKYKNGKCGDNPIGRNKFLSAPKIIAKALDLEDPEKYTGHSFHKKSLKSGQKREIRSSAGLESYIEECLPNKRKMTEMNSEPMDFDKSTEATEANKSSKDIKAWELLPEKSRERYVRAYESFLTWRINKEIDKDCFSIEAMLEYINHLKTKYKPTTLCAEYSKLSTTVKKNDNVDINYPEVMSLLKQSSIGFQPQTCNLFLRDDLRRFLAEADDRKYLAVKVILIFGIYGAASADELTKVEVDDVREQDSEFTIKIPDIETNAIRSFTVDNEYTFYLKKYKKLRPKNIRQKRFFINYQKGKCTIQPIGRNKFLMAPKTVATFLNLEDADNYTGGSFRRTSKKLSTEGCVDILTDKCQDECSSPSAVNEEFISNDGIPEQNHVKSMKSQSTSTNTSLMKASTFQEHNVQPHQVPPHQLLTFEETSSGRNALFQHLFNHTTVDPIYRNTVQVPDNTLAEEILRGMQFNNL